MPSRQVVAKELAAIFKILANADRVRLIEELRSGEKDVKTLAGSLDLPGPRTSQHLALLRAHRLVEERREGRSRLYHLSQPEIADWIIEGIDFVEQRSVDIPKSALRAARRLWTSSAPASVSPGPSK